MKRRPTVQDEADALLQEWSSGFTDSEGIGYPASPVKPIIQGDRPELASPEEYAEKMSRWGRLQSAVGMVGQRSEFHGIILWERYRLGRSDRRIADSFSLDVSTLVERMGEAREMFWEAFEERERIPAVRHVGGW